MGGSPSTLDARLVGEAQRLVLVAAPAGKDLQRIGPLPADLQQVSVGIIEIDALLADVIDGAQDLNALGPQGVIGVPPILLGVQCEGGMTDAAVGLRRRN